MTNSGDDNPTWRQSLLWGKGRGGQSLEQTWKKLQFFRGHVLLTMEISVKALLKILQVTRIIVEIIIHGLKNAKI